MAYYTLGCKVNQYETEKIRQEMESNGFSTVGFSNPADVYIINTCTVTSVADGKSRHAIRRAVRRNPNALVIATGCYADLEPNAVAEIEGVDLILPNDQKDEIARRALARFPGLELQERPVEQSLPRTRTRAVVKVQDGCDQFCAYCAVPLARTGKQSRPLADIVREVESLAAFGYKEVVLTGIRLGSYSSPNGSQSAGVAELVESVGKINGIARIRLSSIEVWEITDRLISVIANNRTMCPHLHVPLQSGDDGTLSRMGRPYDSSFYRNVMQILTASIPDIAITTDIIVGFPGETEDEFERSYAFVEEMKFSRLHVFRYSPRPHTRAALMDEQIPDGVKESRSKKMIELGARLQQEYARSFIGKRISVLAERKSVGSGQMTGLTENYLEAEFNAPASASGQIVEIEVVDAIGGVLSGRLIDN